MANGAATQAQEQLKTTLEIPTDPHLEGRYAHFQKRDRTEEV